MRILSTLRKRPALASLILYQFFFFNIFLPGHTRGAITIDGKHTSNPSPCCCCCGGAETSNSPENSKHVPSERDRENCAICHFAARVMPTPVVSINLAPLGLSHVLPLAVLTPRLSSIFVSTYQGRAPPMPSIPASV